MMIALCCVTGGGDQVKTTRLWSASASNTSGEPEGAKEEVSGAPAVFFHYLVHLAVQNLQMACCWIQCMCRVLQVSQRLSECGCTVQSVDHSTQSQFLQ